jgi:O-antigen ligase
MGPFVNRNHFAGYLLLLIPTAIAVLARALWAWRERTPSRPRHRGVALGTPEGIAVLYASIPVLAMIAALVASTSRGAILALALSLTVALVFGRRGRRVVLAAMVAAFIAMGLAWFGLERLADRFAAMPDNAPGRTRVWRESIERMDGRWLTGSGFNTFEVHLSRVAPWRLPAGATPWPDEVRGPVESGARVGYRYEGTDWYREAHNDYVQVLVETGLPGLAIALWAAWAVLRRTAGHRWVFAALLAMLLHAFVEFDFQIPALPVLFVVLAGWKR